MSAAELGHIHPAANSNIGNTSDDPACRGTGVVGDTD
jgi:hypothetical protein